ncbi:unnamed protein product, partial [Prorocentrum cordatum]
APLVFIIVVVALELAVVDEGLSLGIRAFAWVTLLEAALDRTQTSAPGRRIRSLHVYVDPDAHIAEPRWMEIGCSFWSSPPLDYEGDYLVMLLDMELACLQKVQAGYVDMARMSQAVLRRIRVPLYCSLRLLGGLWEYMIFGAEAPCWTEHSERNVVNNVAADHADKIHEKFTLNKFYDYAEQ